MELQLRKCRTCGELRPIDEFDMRADTGRRRGQCKACRRAYQVGRSTQRRRRTAFVVGASELLRCRKCGRLMPWTEFPRRGRNSDRLQTWCKPCFAAYKAERHRLNHAKEMERIRRNDALRAAANRSAVLAYLQTHPCVDCGERDPRVLEFDHVRDVKRMDVSRLASAGYPWAVIEAEIAKCEVRCANCHRRVTSMRRSRMAVIAEESAAFVWMTCDPGAIRTRDQQLRRLLL